MIVGINHVGMSVSDLDASIAFYRSVLGMEVIVQDAFGGTPYEDIMKLAGACGRAALLRGAKFQIEMFEFARPKPPAPDLARPVCDVGITHFCIEVVDVDAVYSNLAAAGVVFHGPPVDFAGEAKAAYARDPDGNVIEFLEHASSRP
jgi:catechol 2,3-dioxygenase-like lactoylglutathione lyase family enzyme